MQVRWGRKVSDLSWRIFTDFLSYRVLGVVVWLRRGIGYSHQVSYVLFVVGSMNLYLSKIECGLVLAVVPFMIVIGMLLRTLGTTGRLPGSNGQGE